MYDDLSPSVIATAPKGNLWFSQATTITAPGAGISIPWSCHWTPLMWARICHIAEEIRDLAGSPGHITFPHGFF